MAPEIIQALTTAAVMLIPLAAGTAAIWLNSKRDALASKRREQKLDEIHVAVGAVPSIATPPTPPPPKPPTIPPLGAASIFGVVFLGALIGMSSASGCSAAAQQRERADLKILAPAAIKIAEGQMLCALQEWATGETDPKVAFTKCAPQIIKDALDAAAASGNAALADGGAPRD